MVDQVLPNDILRLIFIQLDTVRFILRKVTKLNSTWKNWPKATIRSLAIHPRDNYKRKIDDVYAMVIKNTDTTFPNVKELSIRSPKSGQLSQLLAKFPKLEKLRFYVVAAEMYEDVYISEVPVNIKELKVDTAFVNGSPASELTDLQIYNGPDAPNLLNHFPATLKELYMDCSRAWHTENAWSGSDLKKFTSLEILHIEHGSTSIEDYVKEGPKALKDILLNPSVDQNLGSYLSQKNLPNLKRLQLGIGNLSSNQLAEFKNMEIVDQTEEHVSYDDRFLKNNRDLIRLRLTNQRHMSDLNYLNNLKELILIRDSISSTILKKVLTIKSLERLELRNGSFLEDHENAASQIEPNYNIKKLGLHNVRGVAIFLRAWAHLLRGLVSVKIDATEKEEIYSTYMNNWTRLEKFRAQIYGSAMWHFPVFPNLRQFDTNVSVNESIFDTLAQSPDLEFVRNFNLNAGSTSSFLIENQIYGLLKSLKHLYRLSFVSRTPFKLIHERVDSFVMPEAKIAISYSNGKTSRQMFSHPSFPRGNWEITYE